MKSERRGKFGERKEKILIFAVLFVTLAFVSIGCASADTIYVPEGGNQTIQQAVNNATAGDTIIVRDGTYTENVDVGVAQLTIRAENGSASCSVNASYPRDHVFEVTADYVNISGFTVQNATGVGASPGIFSVGGIYLRNADHCNISENNASNNRYGIYLLSSSNNTLANNTANYNNGDGFYLYYAHNNNISGNTANYNGIGFYPREAYNNNISGNIANYNNYGFALSGADDNNLTDNTANSNDDYGIWLSSSSNNTLSNNTASNNGNGIYLRDSSNYNTLTNNTANYNDDDGIYLFSSCNNTVTSNTANYNDDYGISLSSSCNNTVTNNTANYNNYGIYLNDADSNNLTGNTANNNSYNGIQLYLWSNNNNLTGNSANYNNDDGIHLYSSNRNTLTSNTANENNNGFYLYSGSNNNNLTGNTANENNDSGFYLYWHSNNNNISGNSASNNTGYEFWSDQNSHDNTIENLLISSYPTTISFTYDNGVGLKGVDTAHGDPAGKIKISKYVNATNVSVDSWIFLNVSYSGADLGDIEEESTLKMYKYNGSWYEAPSPNGVNTVENYVYANITSFSIFAPLGNAPPNVTSFAPPSPVNDTICTWRTFNVTVNQTVNVSWYLNDSLRFTNESVTEANCTLHAEVVGEHNVSAIASNENGTDMQTWIWNITAAPAPAPPNVTSFAPPSPVNDTICTWRTFNVTVNQTVNVSWYLNDSLRFTNESVTEANCTLHAEVVGEHNVSAIASNENGTDMQTWIWNVTSAPAGLNCTCGDICVNESGWWHAGGAFNASGTPIQHAINNAASGKTICVKDGIYHENVDVGNRLTIRSENGSASTIVNASDPNDHVFDVTADYVNISGFTVQNATGYANAGIHLDGVAHCNISNNTAYSNDYFGICLYFSSNNTLTGNTAYSNEDGIYLSSSCNYNTLADNTAYSNEDGIYLRSSCNYNTLSGNTAYSNDYGIYLRSAISNNNNLTSNTAYNNSYYGIYLWHSTNNNLTNNTANENSNHGIYLYSSSYNMLSNNIASNNQYGGIYL